MWLEGDAYEFRKAVPRQWVRLGAAAKVLGTIKSPMPGKIIQVTLLAAPCKLQGLERGGAERGSGRVERWRGGRGRGGGAEDELRKSISRHAALQKHYKSMMIGDTLVQHHVLLLTSALREQIGLQE